MPARTASAIPGSSVVSPTPQTNRGLRTTASKSAVLASRTSCSALALVDGYGADESGRSGKRFVPLDDRLAGEDRRLGPAVDEAADARRLGRLEGVARSVDIDRLEVFVGAPLLDVGREVEEGLGAARAIGHGRDVAQVAAHWPSPESFDGTADPSERASAVTSHPPATRRA